jgi:hypothetical protein
VRGNAGRMADHCLEACEGDAGVWPAIAPRRARERQSHGLPLLRGEARGMASALASSKGNADAECLHLPLTASPREVGPRGMGQGEWPGETEAECLQVTRAALPLRPVSSPLSLLFPLSSLLSPLFLLPPLREEWWPGRRRMQKHSACSSLSLLRAAANYPLLSPLFLLADPPAPATRSTSGTSAGRSRCAPTGATTLSAPTPSSGSSTAATARGSTMRARSCGACWARR